MGAIFIMDPKSPLYLKSLCALQIHPQLSVLSASDVDMDTEKSPHTYPHTDEGERGRSRRPFHASRLVGYSTISLTPNTPAGRRNRPFIRVALGALLLLFVVAGWSGWAWERESLGQRQGQGGETGSGVKEGWVGRGSVLGPWVDDGSSGAGEGEKAVDKLAPAMASGMGAGQEGLVHVDAMGLESPGFAGYDGGPEIQTTDVARVEDDGERVDDKYNDDMDDDNDDAEYGGYEDMDDDDDDDGDDDVLDAGEATAESPAEQAQVAEQPHAGGPMLGEAPVLDTIGMEFW